MELAQELRLPLAMLLALATTWAVDRGSESSGLLPPAFAEPWRRALAGSVLFLVFLLTVFLPLAAFGEVPEVDLEQLRFGSIFVVSLFFVGALLVWYLLAYAPASSLPRIEPYRPQAKAHNGTAETEAAWPSDSSDTAGASAGDGAHDQPRPPRIDLLRELGLRTRDLSREVVLGLVAGVGAWLAVLALMLLVAVGLSAVGREDLLSANEQPPQLIAWMAGLSVLQRLLISINAGVVEEIFFRGFLQPRIGIGLSTLLFVLGHLGYGQPFMLIGLTLLSLIYAYLARWRGNVWAAIVAHFLFDAVQLLLLIPAVLESGAGSGLPVATFELGAGP